MADEPDNPEILALASAVAGSYAGALVFYQQLLAEAPDRLDLRFCHACCLAAMGRNDQIDRELLNCPLCRRWSHPPDARFRNVVALADSILARADAHAVVHLAKAEALYALKDSAQLLEAAELGLARIGPSSRLLFLKAHSLHFTHRHPQAVAVADAALAIDPKDANLHIVKSEALRSMGHLAEAIAAAETGLAIDPQHADLRFVKAEALWRLDRFAEAVAAAEAGLALDLQHTNLHWVRAASLWGLDRAAEAVVAAELGLAVDPQHANLHTVKVASLRTLGRFPEAVAAAEAGLAVHPKDVGLHFMKADSLRNLLRFSDALAAAEDGLAIDPEDASLHFVKADSLRNLGRLAEAVATAQAPPPQPSPGAEAQRKVALGDALIREGQAIEALQAYREAIQLQPDEPRYHVKFAVAASESGQMDVMEYHMQQAMRLGPDCAEVQDLLARWHDDRGHLEQALLHSERAVKLAPDDPQIAVMRAWVLHDSGQSAAAWQLIEPLVAAGLPSTHLGVLYGRMAPQLKREPEALAFLERLLASPEIASPFKASLYLSAATLLDRAGAYDKAFEHMRRGKQANRWPHDHRGFSRWIDMQIDYFTPGKLHDLPRASHGNRRPIFIVGMPRSGTSLVEQILASHPHVHGAGELRTLGNIMASLPQMDWAKGRMYPACLDSMGLTEANQLAATYLSTIAALNDRAIYVTDKMPTNFVLLGLIASLFPQSHVIHCTRNPLDTCLSCYMTAFEPSQPFTHDLTNLGAFYRDYHRLMVHWKAALCYPMIEVNYEQLVGDLENQIRRLLTLLDLPWDERCLRYYENKRTVATASRYQVRQPIYTSSIGRWKHYEKYLAELISAMGPIGSS